MDKVEEFKKIAQCQKCHRTYGDVSGKYTHECQHHTCFSCLKYQSYDQNVGLIYKCPMCERESRVNGHNFQQDVSTILLKMYDLFVAKEKKLQKKISIFEQEKAALKATQKDHHNCSECEKTDSEQDLLICATCHELKFEGLENVKGHALCSTCAVKKHIRQGHHTVDFFPYLSAYNFSSELPKIESKSEELNETRGLLNNTFSNFNALSINVSENYNVLTDMARRSKSTKNQLEFIEKMKTLVNESKSIHVGAESELRERTKLLQESLAKIKDWYNSKMDNCVDESEVIELEEYDDSESSETALF